MDDRALRAQLVDLLDSKHAHATFDAAVKGIPARQRGAVPSGWEYSAWQLVEHIRMAQADILEFSVAPKYREKAWPAAYWPKRAAPPSAAAWTASIGRFRRDRRTLQRLARNRTIDLGAAVPNGTGQTYLREILLAADHTAYHVGQLVALRKQLGIWP
jgi:DinB family protein